MGMNPVNSNRFGEPVPMAPSPVVASLLGMFELAIMNWFTLSGQVDIATPVVGDEAPRSAWFPQPFIPVRPCRYKAATPPEWADAREVPGLEFIRMSLLFRLAAVPLVAAGMSKPGDHKANLPP